MKFAFALLSFAIAAIAMPSDSMSKPGGLLRRQNDMPPCEDGEDAPHDMWNNNEDCEKDCWMKEGARNDNYGGVCSGYCSTSTPMIGGGPGNVPMPVTLCRGKE